jgi:hypothetical protein
MVHFGAGSSFVHNDHAFFSHFRQQVAKCLEQAVTRILASSRAFCVRNSLSRFLSPIAACLMGLSYLVFCRPEAPEVSKLNVAFLASVNSRINLWQGKRSELMSARASLDETIQEHASDTSSTFPKQPSLPTQLDPISSITSSTSTLTASQPRRSSVAHPDLNQTLVELLDELHVTAQRKGSPAFVRIVS